MLKSSGPPPYNKSEWSRSDTPTPPPPSDPLQGIFKSGSNPTDQASDDLGASEGCANESVAPTSGKPSIGKHATTDLEHHENAEQSTLSLVIAAAAQYENDVASLLSQMAVVFTFGPWVGLSSASLLLRLSVVVPGASVANLPDSHKSLLEFGVASEERIY